MKTVIEMAIEAGITFKPMIVDGLEYDYREVSVDDNIGGDEFGCIERFAELVRADEREACAKLCEDIDTEYEGEDVLATWCAAAIRARSNL